MTIKEFLVKFTVRADTKAVDNVTSKINGLKTIVSAFAALKIGSYIATQVEHLAELGQETEVLAKAAGLGVVEYQRLAYAAQQNGIEAQRLGISLTRLNKRMIDAKNGTKSAVAMFAQAGISREQIASFQTTEDALYALQDAFADMHGTDAQARKLAIVSELFGRGAHNFLLFMDQGSAVTRKLERDAERAAAVMSKNTVNEMTNLRRAFAGMQRTRDAFFATLLSGVSPLLRRAIYHIQRLLGANRKRLEASMQAFALTIAKTAGFILGVVLGLVQKISRLLPDAGNIFNNFIEGLKAAFTSVLDTNAFAYIVHGIQDIWRSLAGKHVDPALFIKGVKELGEGLVTTIATVIINVMTVVASSIGEVLQAVWNGLVEWLKTTSPQTYEFIKRNFENVLNLVDGLKKVLKSVFDDVLLWSQGIVKFWSDKIGFVAKMFGGKFSDAPFFAPSEDLRSKKVEQTPDELQSPNGSLLQSNDSAIKAMRLMLDAMSPASANAALKAFDNVKMPPMTQLPVAQSRLMLHEPGDLKGATGSRLTVPITINAPNSDPQTIARVTTEKIQEFWDDHMKTAHRKTAPQVAK